MRFLLICTSIIAVLLPLARAIDAPCRPFTIPEEIDLPAGELTLADILPSSACPAILIAAHQVHLGSVPLAGNPRVLTAEEIRGELRKIKVEARMQGVQEKLATEFTTVPERVIVRRRGERESLAATLAHSIVRSPKSRSFSASTVSLSDVTVRPGQTVTLIWDQGGIRVQVPAQCLDAGAAGGEVRARILHSGAVVRATVVGAGSLRVSS